MPGSRWKVRLLAVLAGGLTLAVALVIRAVDDGALEQYSGTALYATIVYATVYFVRPRIDPIPAGAIAIVFCWLVECAQITPVPAWLSARSLLARFVFGVTFDPVDLAWYPVGVVVPVAVHLLVRRRRRPVTHSSGVAVD